MEFDLYPPIHHHLDPEEEEIPEPPAEPSARRGDIYQLGRHRVMCGDCTSREDVEKLMGGKQIGFVVTSPPYNVGKKYRQHNDNLSEQEFKEFIKKAFSLCYEKLRDGHVIAVKIPPAFFKPKLR